MAAVPLVNPSFETGNLTGWVIESDSPVTYSVINNSAADSEQRTPYGSHLLLFPSGTPGQFFVMQEAYTPVSPGKVVKASLNYTQGPASSGLNTGRIVIKWYDSDQNLLLENYGKLIYATGTHGSNQGRNYVLSDVTATAPANAAYMRIGLWSNRDRNSWTSVDNFVWDYATPDVVLTYPINGMTYAFGDAVPFRVSVEEADSIVSIQYIATDLTTSDEIDLGTVEEAPYALNYSDLPAGNYSVLARATYTGGVVVDTDPHTFTVGTPIPPDTREYKASNAYSYLVAKNFVGLGGSIPPTAQIVGMQTVVDYYVEALIRSKDFDIDDLTAARYSAAFDMVPTATFETVLLQENEDSYTSLGPAATEQVEILRSDYTVIEDGVSEGKRWTVLRGADKQVTIGDSSTVFGMEFLPAANIESKALGIRFYPNLAPKPDFADSGDACFRVHIDKLRVQIYFDAGSVEYYFASPDRESIIKGTLASYTVLEGNLSSADAEGVFQLLPELEVMDGSQTWIGNDWTIHAAYPPTDANQIGLVGNIEGEPEVGMKYNALPTQQQVKDNRSRYQFITENFYGDPELNSMYGVHGLERAFAYNGEYFYKIYTQSDPEKDSPRSVANHHGHLALGFNGGRVDISVVGEPYNFDGAMGASSWAFGDKVVGLLPLSGTILGVFGAKSIWGISGTTVDNFATQVVSPNIGAIEYTICDMGFPVYANAYGIYTLSQTQQYGDYLGQPMSRDISPWLRPRLLRKATSDKEVVCAFPVRSKNQYRLCFSDGYVSTMTLNGQALPTFSFQKYFLASPAQSESIFNNGATFEGVGF